MPRLGDVFDDVRDNGRTMRISCHADRGAVVVSLWHDTLCRGSFRLAADDLDRFISTLAEMNTSLRVALVDGAALDGPAPDGPAPDGPVPNGPDAASGAAVSANVANQEEPPPAPSGDGTRTDGTRTDGTRTDGARTGGTGTVDFGRPRAVPVPRVA